MLSSAYNDVRLAIVVCGSLSFLGGLLVFLSFCLFKNIRTSSFALIAQMTFCTCTYPLIAIIFYRPPDSGTFTCTFQGVFTIFFVMAAATFNLAISTHMHRTINGQAYPLNTKKLIVISAISYSVGAFLALLPVKHYDNEGNICFIKRNQVAYKLVCVFIPLFFIIFYNIFCYTKIFHYMREISDIDNASGDYKKKYNTISKFRYYPCKLLACYLLRAICKYLDLKCTCE